MDNTKRYNIQPGSTVTVGREDSTNVYIGGTACDLTETEARAHAAVLTHEDGSAVEFSPLPEPPPIPAASESPAPANLLIPESAPAVADAAAATTAVTAATEQDH